MNEKLLEFICNTRSNVMRAGERVNKYDTLMQFCEQKVVQWVRSSLNRMSKMSRSEVGEQLEHYDEGRRRGALCILRKAEHSAEQRRMEAPLQSKLSFIFEALTCIPLYMLALRYPCSWPGGYWLPFPGCRPVFEYSLRLKSINSQDESATFLRYFLVHWLIAGGLKLQSDCHPMSGNLAWPWGKSIG